MERWEAGADVYGFLGGIKEQYHPHLATAKIGIEFIDSKPYVKDTLNLGKVSKFSKAAKVWHPPQKRLDFCLSVCADVWHDILSEIGKEAYMDLLLCRCKVAFVPEFIEENGKQIPSKDEWGCVKYTNEIKLDKDGEPVWKILPIDIRTIAENIKHFGLWFDDLVYLEETIEESATEDRQCLSKLAVADPVSVEEDN